jgi:cytochrome P450
LTVSLPPGPRAPAAVQTFAWWNRPNSFAQRNRARYGKRYTIRLLMTPPFVILTEPEQLKELFAAPPDVLHPGEGARILEPVVGTNSLILLDEQPHLEQRKLLLPAFHGERMNRLVELMRELSEREVASWPTDADFAAHPRLQSLTLEIILRAVFGLEAGPRLDALRSTLTAILEFSVKPASVIPALQRPIFGRGPAADFNRHRERADELIYELIAERRAEDGGGDDVLTMLLAAEHEDGSPMSEPELRDELMTLLVAGHETTASELAWAFERIAREPQVRAELEAEVDAGDEDAYLTATINETLRRRPVLPNAEPRLVKKPIELGGWSYPEGVCLIASAYLLHHDADVYPEPYAFRPERFLHEAPGTYTWIPFGGGRRRCIGASFATLEMKEVLRAVIAERRIEPAGDRLELTRRRSITVSPRHGARVRLPARTRIESRPPEHAVAA